MRSHEIDLRDQAPLSLFGLTDSIGLSQTAIRRCLGALVGKGQHDPKDWAAAGLIAKNSISHFALLSRLKLVERKVSPVDNFQKLLFRTQDDLSIETVIIPLLKPHSVTLCLSSQVGCVMGCTFCATTRMPTRRNLETWEIVDQYIQAREIALQSGNKVTGVVFMGMGEPFLNYDKVIAAAQLLCFPVFNAISAKAITISTVGLVQEIDRFTTENQPFRLSISLGASTDEKRAKLVPIAARTPITEVIAAARRYAISRNDRVMLSYVCISGENVSIDDAMALGELIGDTKVRLDLIEVTDPTGKYKKPTPDEMNIFRDALTKYVKQPIARRYSGGADIQAACGTLAGVSTI